MKVAVLGSGAGGCAIAFDWAQHGHDVSLFDFPAFPEQVAAINARHGLQSSGGLRGVARLRYAGHDAGRTLAGADLVFAAGPAYSTVPFAEAARPHLTAGQAVVVCPSSCGGGIAFKQAVGRDLRDGAFAVGETNTLPYAVRIVEPGEIKVFLKLHGGLYVSGLPRSRTDDLHGMLQAVYPALNRADSIFQTTLQNGNPVIHPAVTLLNAALIERTRGGFNFYEDGVTRAVGRLIAGVDRERLAIGHALGLTLLPDPVLGVRQGFMQEESYDTGYATADGFRGIAAQPTLDHRYFTEDVGYGLVFLADLAGRLGVATPVIDSVITLVSTIMARDFRGEQRRTLQSLGLHDHSVADLMAL